MSNSSLALRIRAALEETRSQQRSPKLLAESIRCNGRALEGMPYQLIREMESLAHDLDIASWYDEDGYDPDVRPILDSVSVWLSKIPRDAT